MVSLEVPCLWVHWAAEVPYGVVVPLVDASPVHSHSPLVVEGWVNPLCAANAASDNSIAFVSWDPLLLDLAVLLQEVVVEY